MHLRHRFVLPLLAICLSLGVPPALAAKRTPNVKSLPSGMTQRVVGGINAIQAPCQLGQPGAPTWTTQFIYPPDDEYCQFVDPASCACGAGGGLLLAVHWDLNWTTPCQLPAVLKIYKSVLVSPGCYAPDPSQVLYGPISVTLDGSAGGAIDHVIPLPAHTIIDELAFVCITVSNDGTCPDVDQDGTLDSPELFLDASCDNCNSYNIFPGSGGPYDLCTSYFGPYGNPLMWVDGDCPVPTLPGSWGHLRTLYR
jgi:hypothetical protein